MSAAEEQIRADERRRQAIRLYAEANRLRKLRKAQPKGSTKYGKGVEVGVRAAARMLDPAAERVHDRATDAAGTPVHPDSAQGRWEAPEHRVCRQRADTETAALADVDDVVLAELMLPAGYEVLPPYDADGTP